jgi:hypothetical protein
MPPSVGRDRHRRAGHHGLDHQIAPLAGFGLDSLIEIGAYTVVIQELSGTGEDRNVAPCG